jgi:hypothetical protein
MQLTSKAIDHYFSTISGDTGAFIPNGYHSASFAAVQIGRQLSQNIHE